MPAKGRGSALRPSVISQDGSRSRPRTPRKPGHRIPRQGREWTSIQDPPIATPCQPPSHTQMGLWESPGLGAEPCVPGLRAQPYSPPPAAKNAAPNPADPHARSEAGCARVLVGRTHSRLLHADRFVLAVNQRRERAGLGEVVFPVSKPWNALAPALSREMKPEAVGQHPDKGFWR